jgi:ABC-type transporter lipoprotein component MlaA
VEQAALDPYSFTRDLYLQRRANSIGLGSTQKEERYDLPAPAAK